MKISKEQKLSVYFAINATKHTELDNKTVEKHMTQESKESIVPNKLKILLGMVLPYGVYTGFFLYQLGLPNLGDAGGFLAGAIAQIAVLFGIVGFVLNSWVLAVKWKDPSVV